MDRLFDDLATCPDLVTDETVTVPPNETRYTIDMDDATVEQLSRGLCPASFALRCWEMLSWKREHYRNEARESPAMFDGS